MIRLLRFLLITVASLVLILVVGVTLEVRKGSVSKSDLEFLADLAQREGLAAAVSVVRVHLFGADMSSSGDPSYGRVQVEGRGHAPWVIRGNLDGRPRMLKFALRPQVWAAYDTQAASLYQVWRGTVLFEGAAYNYQHGPQPASEGEWYLHDSESARWFLEVNGSEQPATVTYLGHEYTDGGRSARMRFQLGAQGTMLELTETPDIIDRDGETLLTRTFASNASTDSIRAGFYTGDGKRHLAAGTLEFPLHATQAIEPPEEITRGRDAGDDELAAGEAIIASSDCLGCHAPHHRVTGPAWSEISGKFRGKLQETVVDSLANSVIEGSAGTWGPIPMPAHPEFSVAQAKAAIAFILSTGEPDQAVNPPLDASGNPYPATRDYDVLERPAALHPSFELDNLAPDGFEPKVGGMAFRDDGKLLLSSWDTDGAVFLVDPDAPEAQRVQRIAEGLHEPLGLALVDDRLFVLQKQELTELIDTDDDGIIDRYRAVSYDWPSSANFHSFSFGLVHKEEHFYFLLSICVLPGGASCPDQLPTQGKLLKVGMDGRTEVFSSGYRTPNGISLDADGNIIVTDNQGDWLPSSKLVIVREGDFYGSRAVPDDNVMQLEEVPPAIWLPQDEVGNSPTQALLLEEGPYAGQLVHGDIYNGGIKRVFLEDVGGRAQGAVFHFSAGFKGGVNRMERGPDGAIYVGEIGNPPNWGEYGKAWYGLERMRWVDNRAFEMRAVRVTEDGFILELTQPLSADLQLTPGDLLVKQWFYRPDEQYGGPKYNEQTLSPNALEVSADRSSIRARIPGLQPGHVVYLRLDDRLRSASGNSLWTAEAWYTLNAIPGASPASPSAMLPATQPAAGSQTDEDWRDLFDGQTLDGWRNYGGDELDVRKWAVEDGTLTLMQEGAFPMWDLISSFIFGGASGDLIYYREKFRDFELSLEWKISENGNSGIFYLVKDESENTPWRTGIEMQVLDNDGHADGKIKTHRAGDLYDLISAQPETVRPPGEWNEVQIRIQDNHIEHWLNGTRVVSVERTSDEWNTLVAASKFSDMPGFGKSDEGYIVLQDHGDPVWYRNIRVRSLRPGVPAPPPH